MSLNIARLQRHLCLWVHRYVPWIVIGCDRPQRMHRRSRPVLPDFSADEKLYIRVTHSELAKPDASFIRFPDQSTNRSRFSRPLDCLVPDPDFPKSSKWAVLGVAEFRISAVPTTIERKAAILCEIRVEHDPAESNYAHTEIRLYKDGARLDKDAANKAVHKPERLAWRMTIREHASFRTVLRAIS